MSYRSRESKRRKKIAVSNAKRQNATVIAARYYLTVIKRDCRCSACGGKLRRSGDMVFRSQGPVTLCVPCADRDPLVEYRVSERWRKARRPKGGESLDPLKQLARPPLRHC